MAAPLTYLVFWLSPDNHLQYELAALALWYLGCLVAPLAFEDDDMGLMFWLYHFVLLMIPIGCDIICGRPESRRATGGTWKAARSP